jgi:hypothetical protein
MHVLTDGLRALSARGLGAAEFKLTVFAHVPLGPSYVVTSDSTSDSTGNGKSSR